MQNRDLLKPGIAQPGKRVQRKQPASRLSEIEHPVVQRQHAIGRQLPDCGGGDRLGHAGDPHHHVADHGNPAFGVHETGRSLVDDIAVQHHAKRRRSDGVLLGELFKQRREVEFRQGLRPGASIAAGQGPCDQHSHQEA